MPTPIPTINPQPYNDLMNNITAMDPAGFLFTTTTVYTNIMGNLFYLFVWGILFIQFWLAQRSITIPSVIGMILGGIIIGTLPEQYQAIGVTIIALGGFAIIYVLYTERR